MDIENNLETICRQIEAAARTEAEEIVRSAQKKAEDIIKQAEEKNRLQEDAYQKRIDKIKEDKEKRALSYLKLEEKRIMLSTFEELLNNILASLGEEKENFRRQSLYRNVLKQLVREGVESLGRDKVRIILSAEEKDILGSSFETELKKFLKQSFSFLKEIDIIFSDSLSDLGAIVEEKEGRVLFDNTFAQRQRRAYNEIRKIVYEKLY